MDCLLDACLALGATTRRGADQARLGMPSLAPGRCQQSSLSLCRESNEIDGVPS